MERGDGVPAGDCDHGRADRRVNSFYQFAWTVAAQNHSSLPEEDFPKVKMSEVAAPKQQTAPIDTKKTATALQYASVPHAKAKWTSTTQNLRLSWRNTEMPLPQRNEQLN
jgi:hypothetical protein